ncbi:hypothetical protein LWI28_003202 [Acer negundo]|uniref:Uncharacterized protein n=1 Tax=Acer negundo TaxID=4023 RepID=A0AAD5I7H2_ACENE|nr:hypothetical protein LWI28_003202 [Acer negundo]
MVTISLGQDSECCHSSDIQETIVTKVWFLPLLDQPLSSNRYYVVRAKGKYKGQACKSSREMDIGEEIGTWVNVNDEAISVVNVNIKVRRKVNSVFGRKAVKEERVSHDGFVWFRVCERSNRRGSSRGSVGLSVAIVQKMKWVQEEGWWIDGREKEVSVERVEEIRSEGWKKFGCCVLVESFVLRRMDGTLVLRSDFRHT